MIIWLIFSLQHPCLFLSHSHHFPVYGIFKHILASGPMHLQFPEIYMILFSQTLLTCHFFRETSNDWTKVTPSLSCPSSSCLVAKSCPTICNPMNCSTPGFLVPHHLPEFSQTHVHWISDAIQSFHLLPPSSPLALNLSQHQGIFQWVSSSHQVAKVLEL